MVLLLLRVEDKGVAKPLIKEYKLADPISLYMTVVMLVLVGANVLAAIRVCYSHNSDHGGLQPRGIEATGVELVTHAVVENLLRFSMIADQDDEVRKRLLGANGSVRLASITFLVLPFLVVIIGVVMPDASERDHEPCRYPVRASSAALGSTASSTRPDRHL